MAYDFEENVIGVVCIGTVVRDFAGKPVAGLSISVPTQRVRGDNLSALKEQLLSAANKLSAEMGYEAPTKQLRSQRIKRLRSKSCTREHFP